jgi:hypothetical protein
MSGPVLSAAGKRTTYARSGGRRLKSAKARNRGGGYSQQTNRCARTAQPFLHFSRRG